RGIGWYRRYLKLPESDRGRHIELQFDAIATHSTVWINGIVVNRNWSGYNGRSVDITPYVRYGEDVNTIAVRVDADAQEGSWCKTRSCGRCGSPTCIACARRCAKVRRSSTAPRCRPACAPSASTPTAASSSTTSP